MKLNKLILLMPIMLSLTACNGGEKSYAGTYSFQLGSTGGTHAGIHLNLTDEDFPDLEEPAKKFSLEFDVHGDSSDSNNSGAGIFGTLRNLGEILKAINASTDISIDGIEKAYDTAEAAAEDAAKAITDQPIVINGYYRTAPMGKETQLVMGISFDEYEIKIDPELVEMVMFATISSEQVNVVIPVSIKDFLFQLYWYGYRVAGIESLLNPVDLLDEYDSWHEHHAIGTHPTADDIKTIKKHQDIRHDEYVAGRDVTPKYEVGEEMYRDYFDYHTLTMGLMKDGK